MGARLLIGMLAALVPLAIRAEPFEAVPEESIFAVVTHKAGFAARLAHNHLIFPTAYTCRIEGPPDEVERLRFDLSFPVTALTTDTPEAQKRWYPELVRTGILDTPFEEVSEPDRSTIREHMLAKNQLDAAAHPEITVTLTGLERQPSVREKASFDWLATIRFTVHGKTVERAVPASIQRDGPQLTVDAVGEFRFTEFGITPYSAYLGAVKNQDRFHVYVHVQAKARETEAPKG